MGTQLDALLVGGGVYINFDFVRVRGVGDVHLAAAEGRAQQNGAASVDDGDVPARGELQLGLLAIVGGVGRGSTKGESNSGDGDPKSGAADAFGSGAGGSVRGERVHGRKPPCPLKAASGQSPSGRASLFADTRLAKVRGPRHRQDPPARPAGRLLYTSSPRAGCSHRLRWPPGPP